jgi:hypothetical protein
LQISQLPSSYVYYLSALAGPLIAGLAVYIVLSYLFVPLRITTPLAIIISVLVFGLSKYYANNNKNSEKSGKPETTIKKDKVNSSVAPSNLNDIELKQQPQHQRQETDQEKNNNYINKRENIISKNNNNNTHTLSIFANLFFVVGYAACLLIVTSYFFIFNPSNEEIFVPWEQFTIVQIIQVGASIALCFFLPGYAILSILYKDSDYKIRPLLKILLAYLLSILVTGLTGYIAVALGLGLSNIIGLLIVIYLSILVVLLIQQLSLAYNNQKNRSKFSFRNLSLKIPSSKAHTLILVRNLIWNFLKKNSAEFIVFASLFALVVLSTYYLYSGGIIADQWYHHGRSLAFMSGEFRDISIAGGDEGTFSPFPNALLAAFFSVSGIPSVNAYASISFLNIIPVFAFYYFFKNWVPIRMKRSALLACTLFMLSSGFGWVYVLGLAVADPPESQLSAFQMLWRAGIKSMDIILPTSFSGAHPDFSTPLIIMALPAGFTLLGLLREEIIKNKFKFKYLAILLSITFLGVLSHDEFYLFIIVSSIVPIFLFFITKKRDEKKKNLVVVYGALLGALSLTLILATYSFAGVGYFIYNTILGIPLIVLCFIFVAIMCILYIATRYFYNLFYQKKYRNSHRRFESLLLSQRWIKYLYDRRHRTITPRLVLVFVIAWLYIFTFIVWSQLSVEAVEIQTQDYTVPWYLYPMKLGLTGLLGFAFVLSYLFRKFEKEIFIFGIIIVIAFFAGSYYYEHRLNKYMMAGLAGFGSLFIYDIILRSPQIQRNSSTKTLATSLVLGFIIFSSALSVLMFWGFNALAHDSDFDKALGRRDFPLASEFGLFRLLYNGNKAPSAFNIAAPVNAYNFSNPLQSGDLIERVQAFSGIPLIKLTQSPLTLDAYALESFYDQLYRSDTRYIVLPKGDFVNLITQPDEDAEIGTIDEGKKRQQREEEERIIIKGHQEEGTGEEQRSSTISGILRFAIENFQKAYEDSNYLVLAVPPLTPPQSQADIGLIHKKIELLASPSASDKDVIITLPYDKELFKEIDSPGKVKNEEKNVLLYGNNESRTDLWSDPLQQQHKRNANYIESVFRVVGQNESESDVGIGWLDNSTQYTVSLKNDRVEVTGLDIRNSTNSNDGRLVYVREITRENGEWYTIKIIIMEETVNVYVNNLLAVQIPRNDQLHGLANTTINRIGLFSFNNTAEFRPIKVGSITTGADKNQENYFQDYYPLSILALSKASYDTFLEGDMSALSKKIVILNADSILSTFGSGANGTLTQNNYLKFANDGGILVIMNIDGTDYFGEPYLFGKLFDIGDEVKFDSISYEAKENLQNKKEKTEKEKGEGTREDLVGREKEEQGPQYLNVSGMAREIEIRNTSATSDVAIKSYYINNDQKVAPFVFEKKYGMGRLIFVNNGGYFDAVAKSPQQTFLTLAKILNLAGLDTGVDRNYADNHTAKWRSGGVTPVARIVGDLGINAKTKINSSSFSIVPDNNKGYNSGYNSHVNDKFYVQSVKYSSTDYKNIISNSNDSNSNYYDLENQNRRSNDTLIEALRLSGPYEVIINTNGSLVLPSTLESYHNYIGTSIPIGSDIVLKLHNGSTAEFLATNDTGQKLFKFGSDSEIHFYNISGAGKGIDISVLLKSPEIRVADGKISFENLYNVDPPNIAKLYSNKNCEYQSSQFYCRQLEVNGTMDAVISHVDNYLQGEEADTVSYIKSLEIEQNKSDEEGKKMALDLQLPADVSQDAKERGITVPWQKALFSDLGVAVSLSMFAYDTIIVIMIVLLWRPWVQKKTEKRTD